MTYRIRLAYRDLADLGAHAVEALEAAIRRSHAPPSPDTNPPRSTSSPAPRTSPRPTSSPTCP